MADLPHDLLLDVLSRLLVKSLFRFKGVSKLWHSIISSPEFVDFHLHRSKTNLADFQQTDRFSIVVEREGFSSIVFFTLEFDLNSIRKAVWRTLYSLPHGCFNAVGTCNGLICLVKNTLPSRIAFCNPSTREYRQGPEITYRSTAYYGFGYDPKSKDFKLLIAGRFSKGTWYRIYSMKSDSWGPKRKQNGMFLLEKTATFYNGALHFIAELNEKDSVVGFDLVTEEWCGVVPFPDPNGGDFGRLSVLGDSFYAMSAFMDVWVMKSEGTLKSWNKLLHPIGIPLVSAEGGRKVLAYGGGGLMWCDIEKGGDEADGVDVTPPNRPGYDYMSSGLPFAYCESLVSV